MSEPPPTEHADSVTEPVVPTKTNKQKRPEMNTKIKQRAEEYEVVNDHIIFKVYSASGIYFIGYILDLTGPVYRKLETARKHARTKN